MTGKQHAVVASTVAVGTALAAPGIALYTGPVVALGICLGTLVGWLITPDIDHHAITEEERRLIKHFGIFEHAWRLYWMPYEKLFKHRGMSHTPVIGTLTRAIYFPTPAMLAGYLDWNLLVGLLAGWVAQDLIHILGDAL